MGDAKERPLTTGEAAVRLGTSREMVIRRITRGDLKGFNEYGRWFVLPESLPKGNQK